MTPQSALPRGVDVGLIPLLNLAAAFLIAGLVAVAISEVVRSARRTGLMMAGAKAEAVV